MARSADVSHVAWAATGLALLGLGYLAVITIISYRKLQHIPGPRLAAFSQLWLFKVTTQGDIYLQMEKVLRKYGLLHMPVNPLPLPKTKQKTIGSPARIGPNMIIHEDPEIIRFVGSPRGGFTRGHWYSGMQFDPRINNILSETNERRHTELRAKMMPGYTGREVPTLETKVDQRIMDLLHLIQSYIARNKPFDFAEKVQYFTMDTLTDIAFGYPFGFLTKDADLYDYNKSSTAFFPVMELATNIPFIWTIVSSKLMHALAGPKAEDKQGLGAITGVAQKIVAQRFNATTSVEKQNRDPDMLDAFIKHGLTQLEAESESLVQILAGSDSTATSIRMCLLFLLTNPPAYSKLQAEIDQAVADGNISFPVIKNAETGRLKYLQAVIKEGLRLWFPLNGLVTMMSPKEGITINDVYLPGNTQVCLSKYAMLRRNDLFGDDAEVFRPERWLNTIDADKVTEMERIFETYFGVGRYQCLGKAIALMELSKMLVELLRRYDFGLVNPINTMKSRCHQLHVQKDMYLRAWERVQ